MADFSADELIRQVFASNNQSNALLTKGAADLGASTTQAQTLFDKSQEEMGKVVEESAAAAANKAAIDYTKNKTLQNIQDLYGMNPDSNNFEVATQMARANAAREARAPVRQEYDRLSSVDFLSNPLAWIVAQTKLPQVAAQNNALADAEDSALQSIQERTTLMAASKSAITANVADSLRDNALQEAQVQAHLGQARLQQAASENITRMAATRMQQLQVLDKINDNTRSTIGVVASIQNAEESRKLREEQAKRAAVDDELRRAQLQAVLDEKKAQKEEVDAMDQRLAIVSTSLGLAQPMTVRGLRTLADGKAKQAWFDAAKTGSYGANLLDAVTFFGERVNPNGMAKGAESILDTAKSLRNGGAAYVQATAAAMAPVHPGEKAPTRAEILDRAYSSYQTAVENSANVAGTVNDLSSPTWDKTYNPNVAQFLSFNKAIETNADLAPLKDNLVKKQIDTLLQSGAVKGQNLTADQQKQVLLAVQAQIENGSVLPSKAAADVSRFFRTAIAFNQEVNQPTLFGIQRQRNYLFTIPGAGQVDLADPARVENTLTRGVTLQRARNVNLFNVDPSLGLSFNLGQ